MNPDLNDRLAHYILTRKPFGADDVTMNGALTAAGDHNPNAKQNSIGSLFNQASRNGWIERAGDKNSTSPHRKGGLNRLWIGTDRGCLWAEEWQAR